MTSKLDPFFTDFSVPTRRRGRAHKFFIVTLVTVCALLLAYQWGLTLELFPWRIGLGRRMSSEKVNGDTFIWAKLQPSKDLFFSPCYNGFQCAKLELPLDYWNGTYPDETISLAIIKLPAKVPVSDPRYGGPILVNPGGPGGSGVGFVEVAGFALQTLVDSAGDPAISTESGLKAKYYDIISFDPRGIGETTPGAYCFTDGPTSWTWMLREKEEGIIGSSDAALGRLWAMNQALGTSCSHDSESGNDIKKFMTTASVARDMLEIIEKHAEWKFYETQRITQEVIAQAVKRSRKAGYCALPSTPDFIPYVRGTSKLQYWGFSYGSFLGNTFASMYPSRVGRVILDGVVDAEDYLQTLWKDNLNDTEKVVSSFYTYCAAAGFPSCALAAPNATAADVETRLSAIIASLYHKPLPVPGDMPEVITYSDVRGLIFSSLYSPLLAFPLVAQILAAIESRDGTDFARALEPVNHFSCARNGSENLLRGLQSAAQQTIMCSDGDAQTGLESEEFEAYVDELEALSPSSGAIWARLRLRCTAWDIRPLYRFRGPIGGKTAEPLLWIGNTADPVTPVGSAFKMAEFFEDSVVLTQESAGHCSISTPSLCTLAHLRNYLHQGILPPPDTICPPTTAPFGAPSSSLLAATSDVLPMLEVEPELREAARLKLLAAQEELNGAWFSGGWGLGQGAGTGLGKMESMLVKAQGMKRV